MEHLATRIARIRDDHEHGSRWLARSTIELLRDLAVQPAISPEEQVQHLYQAGRELARARPAITIEENLEAPELPACCSRAGLPPIAASAIHSHGARRRKERNGAL